MARQSVSKHLAVLEAANLVTTVRSGREKLHYLNAAPINEIGERWINHYDRGRVEALADLKHVLEEKQVDTRPFVYTSYINAQPEQVWKGLTDPAFTRRYWGIELLTDWKVGSTITWEHHGVTIADPEQVVLESDPYRRLAVHVALVHRGVGEGVQARRGRRAGSWPSPAHVRFEIEPVDDMSKLTVVHEFFQPDSLVATMVSQGWPQVISALKTTLEAPAPQ